MKDAWRHFTAEFLGTFAIVFIGGGTIITTPLLGLQAIVLNIAFAHGLVYAVAVTATMRISGHLNPAVTAGFLVTRRIEPMMAVVYWIAQFTGATVAAYALSALYPAGVVAATHIGALRISTDLSLGQAITLEAIATFLLTFVVFGTAVDPRSPRLGGLPIGLVVVANILAVGPLTGAAMNPARAFGPAVVANFYEGQAAYWLGPLIGGVLAALLYDRLFLARGGEPADHGAVQPAD